VSSTPHGRSRKLAEGADVHRSGAKTFGGWQRPGASKGLEAKSRASLNGRPTMGKRPLGFLDQFFVYSAPLLDQMYSRELPYVLSFVSGDLPI
jgi:hypothetical protein